jgi:hypothetical protein
MGTRSLTYVYADNEPLVCMYRQFDGYPSGHGKELAEFLKPMEIVNGLRPGGAENKIANGAGCLAAQMIAHFKDEPGGIYLQSVTNQDYDWIDYIYRIYVDSNTLTYKVSVDNELKKCSIDKFIDFCEAE